MTDQGNTAALVQTVLDAEAERQSQQTREQKEVLFADELFPGVGKAAMSFREGLATAGMATFVVCMVLTALDQLESSGLTVLAPDIQKSFHVSSGAIVFISGASGGFLILGALPMGWLADRFRRPPIIGFAGIAFAAFVFLSGLAANVFSFFLARFGVGVSKSSSYTVNGALLADAYPINIRGRMSAATSFAAGAMMAVSPVVVGGIASLAGGPSGWRWAFYLLGLPVAVFALLAFKLKDPPRGQNEMRDVLGDVIREEGPSAVSIEAAFARLLRIKTLKTGLLAFSAIGFGLFTVPVLGSLFLKDQYHLDTFHRGLAFTAGSVASLFVLPFAGRYYDSLYRRDPSRALALVGLTILPAAAIVPIQYFMPNAVLWVIAGIPATVLLTVSYSMFWPVVQSVTPYRLRGLGAALGSLYVFFIGATGGAILSGLFTNAWGPRTALLLLFIPSTIIGGLLLYRSSRSIRSDLSLVVAELREELKEFERHKADPDRIPVVQVADIDFSYGQVQVLFGIGFEVRRGEVLALLGTNGAGKSTILQVVAGLGTPSRGVVRLNGRNVTYVSPEQRARLGVQLLPGGKGVFPAMTVLENLEMGSFIYRRDPTDRARRIERVFGIFPMLESRRDALAGSLSGGQQQMLALARVLLHDPEVLMIDELSLGLAPIVVQELIAVVDRLKSGGLTMIIVEQSLNVAAAISDRAVFLEKGQVRFDGPTRELVERDDLARAVFLGGAGA
jgi:ABC-type branched-subunit amino acid transport system ATPase component/predicted MFS family arabinose efflux permease